LGSSFRGAALENSFGEPLWGTGLKHSRFGATALQSCFGEELWEAASGNRFGEQLWGAALASFFGPTLPNNCFEEQQLWGEAFGDSFTDNFGEQLSVATLGSRFAEWLWGAVLANRFAESQALGQPTALENSFGEQRRGTALGRDSFPDQL